jgi:hypothetical protein
LLPRGIEVRKENREEIGRLNAAPSNMRFGGLLNLSR